jgi:hypothetical protein
MGRPPSSGGVQPPNTGPSSTKKAPLNSAHKRAGSIAVKATHNSTQRAREASPASNYSSDELDLNDIEDDNKSTGSKK